MGLLEVKHGLLQMAETLDFLHNNARLIHRAISPEVKSYLLSLSLSLISSHVAVIICVSWSSIFICVPFYFPQVVMKKNIVAF